MKSDALSPKSGCMCPGLGHYAIAECGGHEVRALLEKWLDWPPVWTLSGLVAIWALSYVPFVPGFGSFGPGMALGCLLVGLWLMLMAVLRMRAHGTTIIPHRVPQALVTDSVFAISRNPIYLGDLLILLAATFWANTVLGFLVIGGFVWMITDRFIVPEEERLAGAFGDQAAEWFNRVRRWI
jgi:protein-S-isoprenylcysteine O-methyltransferase Ste14